MQKKLMGIYFILLVSFYKLNCVEKNTIFISLGAQCAPAQALNFYKKRTISLPFDWITTNFGALYKCIDEDFKNFLVKDSLYIDPLEPVYVRDSYGFGYLHDFPAYPTTFHIKEDFLSQYDEIATRYQRRINRLINILKSGDMRVMFIRFDNKDEATKENAILLKNLIASKYPNLDFTVVLLTCSEESKIPWDLPRIKNYFVPWSDIWNYESEGWVKALTDINVILKK